MILMMAIVTQFQVYIQNNHQAGSNTNGQPKYIDGRIKTMLA